MRLPVLLPLVLSLGCGVPTDDVEPAENTDDVMLADLRPRHRLGKGELRRALQDLLQVDAHVIDSLPIEPEVDGFRNVATALELSSLLMEKLAAASVEVAQAVLADEGRTLPVHHLTHEVEFLGWDEAYRGESVFELPMGSPWMAWFSDRRQVVTIHPHETGTYRIEVLAARPGIEAGPAALLEVDVDGVVQDAFLVDGPPDEPQLLQVEVPLSPGTHEVGLRIAEGAQVPPASDDFDPVHPPVPALSVDHVELHGPLEDAVPEASPRSLLVTCDPDEIGIEPCATEILSRLATRAWRRPVDDAEVQGLVGLVHEAIELGLSFDVGLEFGIRRVLMSPHFLFRLELHEVGFDGVAEPSPHPWEAFEVASRLSFFLWSTVPDEQLYACAASGELLAEEGACSLRAQAQRMLEDPRSDTLATDWAYQWLNLREMEDPFKQWELTPRFSLAISEDMVEETVALVSAFQRDPSTPFREVLAADWSYLNNRLADYYGQDLPGSDELVPVSLDGEQRTGLMTHGSLMIVTTGENVTSPVKRAVWLLDTFLCQAVGAPPPTVPELDVEAASQNGGAALDAHLDPACSGCHDILDPLGLPLENYDQAGGWRDTYPDGSLITADVTTTDGTRLQSPADLTAWVAGQARVDSCLASKLTAYATGTSYAWRIVPAEVEAIRARAGDGSFVDLVQAIVADPLFHHQPAELAP